MASTNGSGDGAPESPAKLTPHLPRLAVDQQRRDPVGAEIERGRQIQAGRPAEKEPFLPARDPVRT